MKLYRAIIYAAELLKPGFKSLCSIGDVLHDMRCAPYFFNSKRFFECKGCEGIFMCLYTVIHTIEYMCMTVRRPVEDSTFLQ